MSGLDDPLLAGHPDGVTLDAACLRAICAQLGIRRLSVFGSVARGEAGPDSDIDLLVEFSDRVSLLDLVRAERELSAELGHKVDLVTPDAVSPHLRQRIQKDAKVLYDGSPISPDELAAAWDEWVRSGPQGPPDDGADPTFP